MRQDRDAILEQGETCWRLAPARRAAVLVDGSDYFKAARQAILKARRSIFIIGWDIHGEADLLPTEEAPADGAPTRLRPLLSQVVRQRHDLHVHILLWDYPALYAFEREVLPWLSWRWHTPSRVDICLDNNLPLGGCHHQKLLVIDDALAFVGGLDLTVRRWDTSAHEPENNCRVDPAGQPYDPFHDMQMVVDGEAARALGELARARWREATAVDLPAVAVDGDAWPDRLEPEFRDIPVGVARTIPGMFDVPHVREIEALCVRAIKSARRLIYIENQYLTAEVIAAALIERLRQAGELEVLILNPHWPEGWVEARSMGMGRRRFMDSLRRGKFADRVRVLCPYKIVDGRESPVFIHAKLMIVDDRLLCLGSANLNNRSMGFDTECNLGIEARSDAERRAVVGVRDRLIAEHTGSDVKTVTDTLGAGGSVFPALDRLVTAGNVLKPVLDGDLPSEELALLSRYLADPDEPLESKDLAHSLYGAGLLAVSWQRRLLLTAIALAVLALLIAWNTGPLAEFADPGRLRPWLDAVRGSAWTPLLVIVFYLAASAAVFPITILIIVTSLTFGPWLGFAYALAGSLISAAATFAVGAMIGRIGLRRIVGRRLNRISRALARRGVISVAIVRTVPIAPFTLINLVAGASHIRHRDFLLGTLLGMMPGLIILSAMGSALRRVWENRDPFEVAIAVGVLGAWFAVGILVQRLVSRRSRQEASAQDRR